ncbi:MULTISPECIES: DUF6447 family protein [unclassified Sulfitobacter]|uniref:DUF6447 family protein n=1 Tax=unclassified Sulfitobacter TaxID=196795 RepID=UPI001ADA43FE|nr:DUF6447 family protein [Sulfitobacter sp. R18_1]MBO9432437.1 hypothetical protein [Sulfitobacter sp. R18_1]
MAKVTIDGREYDSDNLSDDAKQQLANVQICEQQVQKLQREIAITQTARQAYIGALKEALPADS